MTNHERPSVVCHMMQTLDGKIASGVTNVEVLMDFFDTYTAIEHELSGKVWMFGRKTAEAFAENVGGELEPAMQEQTLPDGRDFIAEGPGTFAITVDTKGVLRWKDNFITLSNQEGRFHIITIVTKQTPINYLSYLEHKGISYIFAGEQEVDFKLALNKLREHFHIERILLEGGGSLNGSMMSANLVDEISLLLVPRVLNKKDAPSLFDQSTDTVNTKDYDLEGVRKLDKGVLWLQYKRVQAENL